MKLKLFLPATVLFSTTMLTPAQEGTPPGRPGAERATERDAREGFRRGAPGRGEGRRDRQQNRDRGARPNEIGAAPGELGSPGIAWYGRLDLALGEARRSNRPILFMSAASQCGGVPGVF